MLRGCIAFVFIRDGSWNVTKWHANTLSDIMFLSKDQLCSLRVLKKCTEATISTGWHKSIKLIASSQQGALFICYEDDHQIVSKRTSYQNLLFNLTCSTGHIHTLYHLAGATNSIPEASDKLNCVSDFWTPAQRLKKKKAVCQQHKVTSVIVWENMNKDSQPLIMLMQTEKNANSLAGCLS